MHTDPIADFLTRVRNAQAVGKHEVLVPYSKLKHAVADVLSGHGWVGKVEIASKHKVSKRMPKGVRLSARHDQLRVVLQYEDAGHPKIRSIKRISKPGRRVYVGKEDLPIVLSGFGMAVISTSGGLMSGDEARKKGIGGEIVCEIS